MKIIIVGIFGLSVDDYGTLRCVYPSRSGGDGSVLRRTKLLSRSRWGIVHGRPGKNSVPMTIYCCCPDYFVALSLLAGQ